MNDKIKKTISNESEAGKGKDGSDFTRLGQLNGTFLLFIILGFLAAAVFGQTWVHIAAVCLWALACLAVGAFIGLLFGIPRMRRTTATPKKGENPGENSEQNDNNAKYEPEINNNLIEVSDWLTKIIVGLGLVELSKLPDRLKTVSKPLSTCLGTECGQAAAVGIIIFFSFAGFLAGYINARTFLAVMFRHSDDELTRSAVANLTSKVEKTEAKQQAQEVASDLRLQTMRTFVAGQTAAPLENKEASSQPDPDLMQLVRNYESIDDPDYQKRVAKKDQAASAMLRCIYEKKISKQSLYAWIKENHCDGLILALASYILAIPEQGDLPLLIDVGKNAVWLHVKYRVTLALRALFRESPSSADEQRQAIVLLERYREHAYNRKDQSLITLVDELVETIKARGK